MIPTVSLGSTASAYFSARPIVVGVAPDSKTLFAPLLFSGSRTLVILASQSQLETLSLRFFKVFQGFSSACNESTVLKLGTIALKFRAT